MKSSFPIILALFSATLAVPGWASDCDIGSLARQAAQLDKSNIGSVLSLADAFERLANGQPEECVSHYFAEFREFYYQSREAYQEAEGIPDLDPTDFKKRELLRSKVQAVGWDLFETEGILYIGETGAWFLERFSRILPQDWNVYLRRRQIEIQERFSEDAGLTISWEDLGGRIVFWEEYLVQYPNSPLREEVEFYLGIYIRTFLTGLDNSPITESYDSARLDSKVRLAYEAFLKENRDSRYFKLIEGYYRILEKNSFVVTEELWQYLRRNKLKSMQHIQPPTY